MTKDLSTLHGRLLYARRVRGHTQRELAAISGLSQPGIARLESGITTNCHVSTARAICSALNVRLDWLLYGDAPMDEVEQ